MLRSHLVLDALSSHLLRACCWVCAGLLPVGLAAQEGASVLSLLPTEGRAVSAGQEVRGELRGSDHVDHDGNHLQAWEIRGDAGRGVVVDLLSQPLDPYLIVVGPGLGAGLTDDDGGSGLNSRLCVEFPASGTYRIVASALGGRTGAYTLRVRNAREDDECDEQGDARVSTDLFLAELPVAGRTLRVGDTEASELDRSDAQDPGDGSYVEAWSLRLEAGQEVSVDMVSQEFDTYLVLLGPGIEGMRTDDDGAGACNARLLFTARETGTYRVVASSFLAGATGRYELQVTPEPRPRHDGPCPGGMDVDVGMGVRDVGATDLEALPVVGTLSPGYEREGTLASDDPVLGDGYAHAWDLHGTAGETLTVELISDDFDGYLFLTGPGLEVLSDDDSAGSLDSRIEVTFPETGTYRVVATTFGNFGTGAYRLRTVRTR